jgi:hypothetical protein
VPSVEIVPTWLYTDGTRPRCMATNECPSLFFPDIPEPGCKARRANPLRPSDTQVAALPAVEPDWGQPRLASHCWALVLSPAFQPLGADRVVRQGAAPTFCLDVLSWPFTMSSNPYWSPIGERTAACRCARPDSVARPRDVGYPIKAPRLARWRPAVWAASKGISVVESRIPDPSARTGSCGYFTAHPQDYAAPGRGGGPHS